MPILDLMEPAWDFAYSLDGSKWIDLGESHIQDNEYLFLMGHHYGVFNFATTEKGGSITVKHLEITSA